MACGLGLGVGTTLEGAFIQTDVFMHLCIYVFVYLCIYVFVYL